MSKQRKEIDLYVEGFEAGINPPPDWLDEVECVSDEEMAEINAEFEAYMASLTPAEIAEMEAEKEIQSRRFRIALAGVIAGMKLRDENQGGSDVR